MLKSQKWSLAFYNLLQSLLFSIVVLLFVAILINNSINSAKQYTNEATRDSFSRAITAIENSLDSIDATILNNDSIRDLLDYESNTESFTPLLSEIESRIKEDIQAFAFVIGQKDIYSSDGTIRYLEFQADLSKNFNVDASKLYSSIQKCTEATLIHLRAKRSASEDEMIYMLPYIHNGNRVIFLFRITDQFLYRTFIDYLGDFIGSVSIYQTNYQDIYCNIGNSLDMSNHFVYSQSGSGVVNLSDDGKKLIGIRMLSEQRSLGFLYISHERDFYNTIGPFYRRQAIMFISIAICLLIFCALIYSGNVIPIIKYIRKISPGYSLKPYRNELELIDSYQQRLINENASLSEQLSNANRYAISHIVRRLILGIITKTDELQYQLSCANVQLPYNNFAVLYASLPSDSSSNDNHSIIPPLFESQGAVMLIADLNYENAIAILVNFRADGKPESRLDELAKWMQNRFKSNGFDGIILGIGDVGQDILKVSVSFSIASAAAKLRFSDENGLCHIMQHNQIQSTEENYYPLFWEFISRNQISDAIGIMERISEGISESTNSFTMYKMRALGLIQFWSTEIRQCGTTLPDEMLEKIANANTREDFENNCKKMIQYSCQAVQEAKTEHQLRIRRSVIQYLQSNFTDFNLSLNSMSDALGIRPAQINEILKKDIGMTFLQYVSSLRLAEFKHLLLTSDKTIQSLVQEVGYVDVSAFIRKFRQTEGMTPGEYREKAGKE